MQRKRHGKDAINDNNSNHLFDHTGGSLSRPEGNMKDITLHDIKTAICTIVILFGAALILGSAGASDTGHATAAQINTLIRDGSIFIFVGAIIAKL